MYHFFKQEIFCKIGSFKNAGIYRRFAEIGSITGSGCKKLLGTVLVCSMVMGWWGVLYPQLSLNQDTYCIVSEDGTVQNGEDMVEWESGDTVYMEILNAESGRIRFRCRLFDYAAELYNRLCGE